MRMIFNKMANGRTTIFDQLLLWQIYLNKTGIACVDIELIHCVLQLQQHRVSCFLEAITLSYSFSIGFPSKNNSAVIFPLD